MSKEDLTILIFGSGGREHALSEAYEKSQKVKRIIVSPGNDFISYKRKKELIIEKNCILKDTNSILSVAQKYEPDIIDVAQEEALARGAVDILEKNGFCSFGPKKEAARIEWDKKWSREIMLKYEIPHPLFKYFDNESEAEQYVEMLYSDNKRKIIYIKASGLCSGKGALKSSSLDESVRNIKKMKDFNEAGKIFLVEEGLNGEEFSVFAISDGVNYKIFKSAQDNKTVNNFDEGDQTGGMGVISPAMITVKFNKEIEKNQISNVIRGMNSEKHYFRGILYLGGIVEKENIFNIEYNARWGDPECQVVLPSLETDYLDLVIKCLEGKLNELEVKQDDKTRICVVGASKGYPNDFSNVKGKRIYGIEEVISLAGIKVYGAGIKIEDGKFYAEGGRLFNIVSEGNNILDAKERAYAALSRISIEGNNLHYRTDIGWRDIERFRKLSEE